MSWIAALLLKKQPSENMPAEPIGLGFTLEYGDRTVTFPILSSTLWHNAKGTLCIEIEGDWGNVDMSSLDGAYGPPMINAGWDQEKFTAIASLSGSTIRIQRSYNEDAEDHVSTFYLSEYLDIDDLKLQFGQLQGTNIPVDFSGFVSEDPTGSNPNRGIKVSGHAIATWTGDS